ncbi:PINIT domain-containing protein [Coprinopsis sp. MPI-PUGE-AT-0042]|nr:PINIT domain-containing protein [Coprinopsis sp. MPI-PUGE-AT-0042]
MSGMYARYTPQAHSSALPTFPGQFAVGNIKTAGFSALNGATSAQRYDPYAPPQTNGAYASTSTAAAASRAIGIRFKDSPFFSVDQAVSGIIECPESSGAMDRRQQTLSFALNNDQLVKLKSPGSKYQLRLFCTSSTYYSRTSPLVNHPCPIEFPPTCEVRVNSVQVTANLKGLKKKPGTAPPPDLAKYVRFTSQQNRIEMVYVNSSQPAQAKKYYMIVMLVETTTIDRLVDNLKANCRRTSAEIQQKMKSAMTDDDDIQAGPQKMSLKDPLSFARVQTPCRSSRCVHPQCFDATAWFSVMEQTTTYLCPTCERVLDHKELIIDGYFEAILQQTDEDTDDVIVEADGEWHTADNKYASAGWRALHPVIPKASSPVVKPSYRPPEDKGKAKDLEVFVLSDDEDEDAVKRELSPGSYRQSLDSLSVPSQSTRSQSNAIEDVIDLTLSDDEEPPPPLPPLRAVPQPLKRKATSDVDLPPIDTAWKKHRGDTQEPPHSTLSGQHHQPPPQSSISPVYRTAAPAVHDHRGPPTRPGPQHSYNTQNGYSQQPQAPYSNYPGRPSLTESRQLPPPHAQPYPRLPSASRWPPQ